MSMRRKLVPVLLGMFLACATDAFGQDEAPVQSGERATATQERKGESRKVARDYEIQARANPMDPKPKVRAAELYETIGDLTAATTAANEALKRDGNNVDALLVLGRIAARQQDWGTAVQHFRRAVILNPENAAAQLDLGQALEQIGDQEGADAAYLKFRTLSGPSAPQPGKQPRAEQ